MQICFYFPSLKNDQNSAIFGSMYSSFFTQLETLGLRVKFTTDLHEIEGDILVVGVGGGGETTAAKAMNRFKGPVIINLYNAYLGFNKPFLKRWSNRILFAYNTDFSRLNSEKCSSVDIKFFDIPFASDEKVFYPLNLEKKYDIAFLGNANSGFGRERYIEQLVSYAKSKKLKVFLAGAGWEKFGFPYQIVKHGSAANEIYNLAKICVNIHNDRQYAGIDKEMDANNRLFDLAMSQTCQIANGKEMIAKYFSKDEVITADAPNDWLNMIDYYLNNDSEREVIAINARNRALADHTWDKRATEFIRIINENYADYYLRKQQFNPIYSILKYLDQHSTIISQFNQIRVIVSLKKKFKD